MKTATFALVFLFTPLALADDGAPCAIEDTLCLMQQVENTAQKIEETQWKDKAYRELAKTYTYEGYEDKAIALISKISSPDTQAMAIRGIGFAAADSHWQERARYNTLFEKLHAQAKTIQDAPSFGIALTYIAMAQAYAGDDAGATATAKGMENDALRHKAFGESAEIQAERGDFNAAMGSISHIESIPFRNKAYGTLSKIFVQKEMFQEAYDTSLKIDNPYQKAESLQLILNAGNPEETLTE